MLIGLAILIAIDSVGIDLTALAVVGGAIGLGIGFGLQKVIGNLISGVILLLDKSIKPGDVIAVSGTYGWVTALGGRYVSVVTRDGVEHLIPNETLISERVENWTHTHNKTRVKLDVGVHYDTDVRRAIELCTEAAAEVDRVLDDPQSKCLLVGFGDSSVELQVRFWIADAHNGVTNMKSAVLLRIWDKFKGGRNRDSVSAARFASTLRRAVRRTGVRTGTFPGVTRVGGAGSGTRRRHVLNFWERTLADRESGARIELATVTAGRVQPCGAGTPVLHWVPGDRKLGARRKIAPADACPHERARALGFEAPGRH